MDNKSFTINDKITVELKPISETRYTKFVAVYETRKPPPTIPKEVITLPKSGDEFVEENPNDKRYQQQLKSWNLQFSYDLMVWMVRNYCVLKTKIPKGFTVEDDLLPSNVDRDKEIKMLYILENLEDEDLIEDYIETHLSLTMATSQAIEDAKKNSGEPTEDTD